MQDDVFEVRQKVHFISDLHDYLCVAVIFNRLSQPPNQIIGGLFGNGHGFIREIRDSKILDFSPNVKV